MRLMLCAMFISCTASVELARAQAPTTAPARIIDIDKQPEETTASTTQPTTRPAKEASAEKTLREMLKAPKNAIRPLSPERDVAAEDETGYQSAVPPEAPAMKLVPEGTLIIDRLGRLKQGPGRRVEFIFEADGRTLRDPPVIIVPSSKLMKMETEASDSSDSVRFRVTGTITEYRSRNYLMLEKVIVVPDASRQL